jgi:release factor glutamine methyltransferase
MATNFTIKKVISLIKSELKNYYPDKELSALTFIILEQVLDLKKTQVLVSDHNPISKEALQRIKYIISELKTYKPIQYIFEKTYFYDLPFHITPDVLIPRPETEELVDWIIKENPKACKRILDIGTGSGCIAISLAKNLPCSTVYAIDVSKEALTITRNNSKLNNVDLRILNLDIFNIDERFDEMFDIIVSNPPYITEKEKAHMQPNVLNYEPELALFVPNNNPLLFYKKITDFALKHLNPEGKIYFETNEHYGHDTALLLEEMNFHHVSLRKDINGKERMLRAVLIK